MRLLVLSLASGERSLHPLVPVLTRAPFVDAAWMIDWAEPAAENSIVLLRVVGDQKSFERVLAAEPVVLDYEITAVDESSFYAYVESVTTDIERDVWRAFTQDRSLLVPPLKYNDDGTITCRIVGSADELGAALADVPDGIEATVERVGAVQGLPGDVPATLTDRQLAAVRAARDVGYYEVPRQATAADVADDLNCSPSTASEHLRKAEARLVEAFLKG